MTFRWTWQRGAVLTGVVLLALTGSAARRLMGPPPTVTIGRDTTWVDGPRDANGEVDYDAAWRRDHAAGVTPENNAAPLVFAALGLDTRQFSAKERAALPNVASPYQSIQGWGEQHSEWFAPSDLDYADQLSDAFDAADLDGVESEAMAGWLDAVGASLDLIRKAAALRRFYVPHARDAEYGCDGDAPRILEEAGRGLAWRGLRRASTGSFEDALADIEAALRLASLERSLDVAEFVRVACETERTAWRMARQITRVSDGVTRDELARLQSIDATPLESRVKRLLPAVRIAALEGFVKSLRAQGLAREQPSGGIERLGRLLVRQIDPDRGCRRINAGFDEIEDSLISNAPWNERIRAFRAEIRRRRAALLFGTTREVLLPSSEPHLDRLADLMLLSAVHDAEPAIVGLVHDFADADIAIAELGAVAYANATSMDPSTSDDLTPLIFARPFRDRIFGATVSFARDDQGRIVAKGAVVDFQNQLEEESPSTLPGEKDDDTDDAK